MNKIQSWNELSENYHRLPMLRAHQKNLDVAKISLLVIAIIGILVMSFTAPAHTLTLQSFYLDPLKTVTLSSFVVGILGGIICHLIENKVKATHTHLFDSLTGEQYFQALLQDVQNFEGITSHLNNSKNCLPQKTSPTFVQKVYSHLSEQQNRGALEPNDQLLLEKLKDSLTSHNLFLDYPFLIPSNLVAPLTQEMSGDQKKKVAESIKAKILFHTNSFTTHPYYKSNQITQFSKKFYTHVPALRGQQEAPLKEIPQEVRQSALEIRKQHLKDGIEMLEALAIENDPEWKQMILDLKKIEQEAQK